jgi:iron complex outermembrane receptor protein
MLKILYSIMAMVLTTQAFTQNNIQGSLLDVDSKQPIFGASIYFPQLEKGSITSVDGKFQINNVSPGTYQMVVSSLGYASKTVNVAVPVNDPLVIELQTSAIEMEAVIVSTPFHRLQSENVVMVARETVEDLNRSGAISLADGITQIPGVESVTTGAGIGKPVIRGLSSNRVLVYSQGVRMENQQYGDEHGMGISSSGVESVEVIKGPASLLYGSDALGGVLYLNPEKFAPANNTIVDGRITYHSNTLGTEANAGIKSSGDRFRVLLRGNYAAHSDYEAGNGIRVTNSRFDEIDVKAGLGYQDDKYRGDLRYNYNNSQVGIPEEIGEQSTSKEMLLPYQQIDNHILSLDNKLFFSNSSLDFKVGYLFNNRKEFEDEHHHDEGETEEEHEAEEAEEGEEPALEMHLQTLNYDVKYNTSKWRNFETIFGVQGMFQTNTNFGEEILIPDASVRDIGVLATTHYHLEKIDFQAGLRFDNRNLNSREMGTIGEEGYFAPVQRDFTSYNGALGMRFNIFKTLVVRVNAASGFRAPNLAELTANGSHEGTNRYEVGNPNLENEQNFQLDLALEYRNEHFEMFTNAFYNKINNYIYLNPTNEIIENDPVFEYFQENALLFGGEAGLHIHPHPIDWLHFESSVELVNGQREGGENLPLIPATSLTNTLRTEWEKMGFLTNSFAFITVKSTLEQNEVNEFETITPAYTLLSAGIGGKFKFKAQEFGLRVGGTNLLNKTYISHLSRLKPDGIPNRGRNISISLNASF